MPKRAPARLVGRVVPPSRCLAGCICSLFKYPGLQKKTQEQLTSGSNLLQPLCCFSWFAANSQIYLGYFQIMIYLLVSPKKSQIHLGCHRLKKVGRWPIYPSNLVLVWNWSPVAQETEVVKEQLFWFPSRRFVLTLL